MHDVIFLCGNIHFKCFISPMDLHNKNKIRK